MRKHYLGDSCTGGHGPADFPSHTPSEREIELAGLLSHGAADRERVLKRIRIALRHECARGPAIATYARLSLEDTAIGLLMLKDAGLVKEWEPGRWIGTVPELLRVSEGEIPYRIYGYWQQPLVSPFR